MVLAGVSVGLLVAVLTGPRAASAADPANDATTTQAFPPPRTGGAYGAVGRPAEKAGELPPGWSFTPRVRLSEIYTDNVALTSREEQSDTVTELTPGFRLEGRSLRAQGQLDYQAQGLSYARDSSRNTTNQRVAAQGNLAVVRQELFLEADATRTQQNLSPESSELPIGSLAVVGEQTNVTTYGGGPRIQHEFGDFARFRARFRAQHADYEGQIPSSDSDLVTASLTSGLRFERYGWSLAYERRREELTQSDVPSARVRFDQTRAEANARVSASTQLFAAGGYESNDFQGAEELNDTDGPFWETGVRWNRPPSISSEVAFGERYFGHTGRASVSYTGPFASLDLRYAETLFTDSELRLLRTQQLVHDAQGNVVLDPSGSPVFSTIPLPTATNQVILERRTDLDGTWTRGRSTYSVGLFRYEREYQGTNATEDGNGGQAGWHWRMQSRTDLDAGVARTYQTSADSDREDTLDSGFVSLTRRISPTASGFLRYDYVTNDSNFSADDYRVNLLSVSLVKTF